MKSCQERIRVELITAVLDYGLREFINKELYNPYAWPLKPSVISCHSLHCEKPPMTRHPLRVKAKALTTVRQNPT